MISMIIEFILFEGFICGGRTSVDSTEICILLLEISDLVILLCIFVTVLWCGHLLHAIEQYEFELAHIIGCENSERKAISI